MISLWTYFGDTIKITSTSSIDVDYSKFKNRKINILHGYVRGELDSYEPRFGVTWMISL